MHSLQHFCECAYVHVRARHELGIHDRVQDKGGHTATLHAEAPRACTRCTSHGGNELWPALAPPRGSPAEARLSPTPTCN